MQTHWLIEHSCENKQKDDIEEIHSGDGNVECVSLLIHPWSKNANGDEKGCFDYYQSDSLGSTAALGEGYEYCFDKNIA